jgi:molybdate transport system substrate-binding protein
MPMKRTLLVVAIALAAACGRTEPEPAPPAAAEPVRVLSSNGVKAVVEALQPDIEKSIGRPLDITFSTSNALKAEIDKGTAFDVAILTPALIRELSSAGRIAAGSEADIARTGVGVGAREGAPRDDVGTPEALKALLLKAKSVAFTEAGQSRATIDAMFQRFGIEDAMKAKAVLKGPGEAPEAVARGEADLVLTLISEILPVKGVQLLGPLPPDVQNYVSFTGGRSAEARDAAAADAVLQYLSGATAEATIEAKGMEVTR